MNVYKLTVMVIDFDDVRQAGIVSALECARYPNRCISPSVVTVEKRDIGEWDDDHPLNRSAARVAEFERLFSK